MYSFKIRESEEYEKLLDEMEPWLIKIRRSIHRNPELGFKEFNTAALITKFLKSWGLEVQEKVGITGVVGTLRGKSSKPVIALRADMDALPIQDKKTVDYKSEVDGIMHACGHDAHVTMLLGAAYILSKFKETLRGTIIFIFQPAEEGPGGAQLMIDEGVVQNVDMIFGQHMDPHLPIGTIGIQKNKAMAAIDKFNLKIHGKSGHGAYPHESIDAIIVAAHIIIALQSIVSRMVNPLEEVVITIGTINGGYRRNIIADEVELGATIRSFDNQLREELHKKIENVVEGITKTYGAKYSLKYEYGYAPLINHSESIEILDLALKESNLVNEFREIQPVMSSEDFSAYLNQVPGCFWWLGGESTTGLHNAYFDIDERALKIGVSTLVNVTEYALDELNKREVKK